MKTLHRSLGKLAVGQYINVYSSRTGEKKQAKLMYKSNIHHSRDVYSVSGNVVWRSSVSRYYKNESTKIA